MNREIMKQAGFSNELELIDQGKCPMCKQPIGQFRDELSRAEFGISGMCQKCQDETFDDPDEPVQVPFVGSVLKSAPELTEGLSQDGDVFIVAKPYRMFSGAHEASKFVYRKLEDKQGHVWLYPANSESPAEQVHFHNPRDLKSQGYGGSTLHFTLEDGTIYAAKGPWHANADAMFAATGVDIRETHWTYGCVAKKRVYIYDGSYSSIQRFEGVLYADKEPVLGSFDRLQKIAVEWADKLGHPVAKYACSKGGSSSGYEVPSQSKWDDWREWFRQ